jgi:hypothetical protein
VLQDERGRKDLIDAAYRRGREEIRQRRQANAQAFEELRIANQERKEVKQ